MQKLATLAAISAFLCCSTGALAQQSTPAPAPAPAAVPLTPAMPAECAAWIPKATSIASIKDVKRIFVDSFGEDPVAAQIQAMVVTQLIQSGKFVVTENRSKADAFLRGTGVEKTSVESHSYESGTAAGGAYGLSAAGAAINDAASSSETVNDARVSVRLVNQDGDVLWATSQDSKGAKYKGASADVADKVVKQLIRDIERLEKRPSSAVDSAAVK